MVYNQVVALFLTKPKPRTGRVILLLAAAVAAVMAAAAGAITPTSKKMLSFCQNPKNTNTQVLKLVVPFIFQDYSVPMSMIQYLSSETSLVPWQAAANKLAAMETLLKSTDAYPMYRKVRIPSYFIKIYSLLMFL